MKIFLDTANITCRETYTLLTIRLTTKHHFYKWHYLLTWTKLIFQENYRCWWCWYKLHASVKHWQRLWEKERDLLIQGKKKWFLIRYHYKQSKHTEEQKQNNAMAKAEVPEHYTVSGIIGAPTINNRHVLVSLRQKEFTGWVLGGPKAWAIAGESDIH